MLAGGNDADIWMNTLGSHLIGETNYLCLHCEWKVAVPSRTGEREAIKIPLTSTMQDLYSLH